MRWIGWKRIFCIAYCNLFYFGIFRSSCSFSSECVTLLLDEKAKLMLPKCAQLKNLTPVTTPSGAVPRLWPTFWACGAGTWSPCLLLRGDVDFTYCDYYLKGFWVQFPPLDVDEGSFLTFAFSKVVIFCYLWKTFKVQSRNIHFTFEVQRSLQTKTLKVQRLLQKPLKRKWLKTIICLGLVDPIAERFYTLDIASSSHNLCMNCSWW